MNIDELKTKLIDMISQTEDIDWLNEQLAFAKKSKVFWSQLNESDRVKLRESIAQADRGEVVSHEKVLELMARWS